MESLQFCTSGFSRIPFEGRRQDMALSFQGYCPRYLKMNNIPDLTPFLKEKFFIEK